MVTVMLGRSFLVTLAQLIAHEFGFVKTDLFDEAERVRGHLSVVHPLVKLPVNFTILICTLARHESHSLLLWRMCTALGPGKAVRQAVLTLAWLAIADGESR